MFHITLSKKWKLSNNGKKTKLFKILMAILVIVLLWIILVVIATIFTTNNYQKYDSQSISYVQTELPKIFTDWNDKELLRQADPDFLSTTPKSDLDKTFAFVSKKLGVLKSVQKYQKDFENNHLGIDGNTFQIAYTVKAIYEKGNAAINLYVRNKNGKWSILGFEVHSDVLNK